MSKVPLTAPERNELLEIYKLHAGFADRVSERREAAHRLFVTLLTARSLKEGDSLNDR